MRSNTTRGLVATLSGALLALALAVFVPQTAQAAPCVVDPAYEGGITVTVDDPDGVVDPGQTITINGSGFPPGCEVTITIDGVIVGSVTTDAGGSFSFGTTLGANISGTVTIGVSAGSFSRTITLAVAGAQVTTTTSTTVPGGNLPRTGADSTRPVGIALALVAVGGLLVVATRRRSAASV